MEREYGDSDDDSLWYSGVIFVHTVLHYPGVSDSQAPFCGLLRQKRKMVLKRNRTSKDGQGSGSGRVGGHRRFTVKAVISTGLSVVLNLLWGV